MRNIDDMDCLVKCVNTILGRNTASWEEVLVSGRDAEAGTNSWIRVDSWDGKMSWIGAEHLSWARTSPPGGTAAAARKARAGVKSPPRVKIAITA